MRHVNRASAAAIMDLTAVHLDAVSRETCPFPEEIRQRAAGLIES